MTEGIALAGPLIAAFGAAMVAAFGADGIAYLVTGTHQDFFAGWMACLAFYTVKKWLFAEICKSANS
jgi:hypothetical protein